jgi:hypothetical protein
MKRRAFVKLLAGSLIAAPFSAEARAANTYRLAMLVAGPASPMESPLVKIIIGALAGHGYTLSQNLELRSYGADAHLGRLPQLAKDIAASRADAVVVLGWPPGPCDLVPRGRFLGPMGLSVAHAVGFHSVT